MLFPTRWKFTNVDSAHPEERRCSAPACPRKHARLWRGQKTQGLEPNVVGRPVSPSRTCSFRIHTRFLNQTKLISFSSIFAAWLVAPGMMLDYGELMVPTV